MMRGFMAGEVYRSGRRLELKGDALEITKMAILEHLDFLRWKLSYVDDVGNVSAFNGLREELRKNGDSYLYVNLPLDKFFTVLQNLVHVNAKFKARADKETRDSLRPLIKGALAQLGIEEYACDGIVLKRFKTKTILKIPFENIEVIHQFAVRKLAQAVEQFKEAQLNGGLRSDGRAIKSRCVLSCPDGEHEFALFEAKNPKHPRFFGWLTGARKKERLSVLSALTNSSWIEIDLNTAVPQGICRHAGCVQALAKMATNEFLSSDAGERAEQKAILTPDTFKLTSKHVRRASKDEAADRLKMFFTEFPKEWELYTNYTRKLRNVHTLFDIEDIMRKFQETHPYAINVHDAMFFPEERQGDILELIHELQHYEQEDVPADVRKIGLSFKVVKHERTTSTDVTDEYLKRAL